MKNRVAKISSYFKENTKYELRVWIIFGLALFIICFEMYGFIDTDMFYIIGTGNEILDNGIPYTNEFCTVDGLGFVCQNWLYCVILAFANRCLSIYGLYIVFAVQYAAMLLLTYKFILNKGAEKHIAILGSAGFAFIFGYVNIRPQMITHIIILLEIMAIEKFLKEDKIKYLIPLPILTCLEANIHASYLMMHIIVILPYLLYLPKIIQKNFPQFEYNVFSKSRMLKLFVMTLLSIGTAFINPYGYKNVIYTYYALSDSSFEAYEITEQQHLELDHVMIVLMILSVLMIVYLARNHKLKISTICFYAGFLFLFGYQSKWVPFFALSVAILYADSFAIIRSKFTDLNYGYIDRFTSLLLIGVFLIASLVLNVDIFKHMIRTDMFLKSEEDILTADYFTGLSEDEVDKEISIDDMDSYMGEIPSTEIYYCINYLKKYDPDAKVYGFFEIGGYFQSEGFKTYGDPRPEVYFETISGDPNIAHDMLLSYYGKDSFNNNKPVSYETYVRFLNELDVDYFCVYNRTDFILNVCLQSRPDMFECLYDGAVISFYKKAY